MWLWHNQRLHVWFRNILVYHHHLKSFSSILVFNMTTDWNGAIIKRCPDIVPPDLTNSCMSRHLIYRQHCTVPKRLICNRMVYTQAMIKMPLENCYLFSQKSVFLLSYCYKGILGFWAKQGKLKFLCIPPSFTLHIWKVIPNMRCILPNWKMLCCALCIACILYIIK